MDFPKKLQRLNSIIEILIRNNIDISKPFNKSMYNFKEKKREYYFNSFISAIKSLKHSVSELDNYSSFDNKNTITNIISSVNDLDEEDLEKLRKQVDHIASLYSELDIKEQRKASFKMPKNLPSDIISEISVDIKELEKCFDAGSYRSAVMLAGRILEIALFRKYYDATGIDLLEKAPGTGLGNLIAKLKDKNIELDPGLANQIHLINQIRVVSVHKKKIPFMPSRKQTQAIILYTLDSLEKLF